MFEIFEDFDIYLDSIKKEKFEKYYELLVYYNGKFNITSITDKREVYVKHFLDSIIGGKLIFGKTVVDVGSGGGFPALPLKIYNEDLEITLIEATGKKCEFLKTVIKELSLENVTVINDRAENAVKTLREKFDFCTARAVARLNSLSEYCLPFVKAGGSFIAYKGDAGEEVKEAENAVKILGGKIVKKKEYLLDGAKRTLIEIKKISPTDKKYPRGNGKERKNPL